MAPSPGEVAVRRFAVVQGLAVLWKIAIILVVLVVVLKLTGGS